MKEGVCAVKMDSSDEEVMRSIEREAKRLTIIKKIEKVAVFEGNLKMEKTENGASIRAEEGKIEVPNGSIMAIEGGVMVIYNEEDFMKLYGPAEEESLTLIAARITSGSRPLTWQVPDGMKIKDGDILLVETSTGDRIALARAIGEPFKMKESEYKRKIATYLLKVIKNIKTIEGLQGE